MAGKCFFLGKLTGEAASSRPVSVCHAKFRPLNSAIACSARLTAQKAANLVDKKGNPQLTGLNPEFLPTVAIYFWRIKQKGLHFVTP